MCQSWLSRINTNLSTLFQGLLVLGHLQSILIFLYANLSTSLSSPPFDEDQIRVLIFQEDHLGQKSLLLDTGKNDRCFPSDGTPRNYINSDIKMFKEIMFGSVAVKIDKTTVKVHEIRIPPQLLVTKVFTLDRFCKLILFYYNHLYQFN